MSKLPKALAEQRENSQITAVLQTEDALHLISRYSNLRFNDNPEGLFRLPPDSWLFLANGLCQIKKVPDP